jgi:chemotaxis protein CheD
MSVITVGISDLAVSKAPDIIATYALGSCVGICLIDQRSKIGGLAHIMLPNSKEATHIQDNLKKFADTGIAMLIREIERAGGNIRNLKAKIAGGAQMFSGVSSFNIGERNVKAVKQILQNYNIEIVSEQTGDKIGRTIFFNIETGMVEVKSAARGTVII